ncbi:hypothetical protein PHMEG_00014741 [Phytophthora megakarya]|uniref:Uncharacterized protein n=1 Tax=Phytophthora megakarya TaxID=4795 RepID=A0A225W3J3_9STRA|nr:hypothetical protein PHMEG_00014741 [Phytophthora megakarya]
MPMFRRLRGGVSIMRQPKGHHRLLVRRLAISNQGIRLRWSLWILSLRYLSPIDQFSGYIMCKPQKPKMSLKHMKSVYSGDLGKFHDQT